MAKVTILEWVVRVQHSSINTTRVHSMPFQVIQCEISTARQQYPYLPAGGGYLPLVV